MRKLRPYHYGGMVDDPQGGYVTFSDAEAAIEQARRDEREKCVAELEAMAMTYATQENASKEVYANGITIMCIASHLAKGLEQ